MKPLVKRLLYKCLKMCLYRPLQIKDDNIEFQLFAREMQENLTRKKGKKEENKRIIIEIKS